MKYTQKIVACSLLWISTASFITPIKTVSASPEFTEVDLIAQRGIGKFVKEAGQWVFVTTAGIVVKESISRATAEAFDATESRSRLEELAERIHQEEYAFYTQNGFPIPITNQNVDLIMQRIGASPSEQNFVVNRMSLYQ